MSMRVNTKSSTIHTGLPVNNTKNPRYQSANYHYHRPCRGYTGIIRRFYTGHTVTLFSVPGNRCPIPQEMGNDRGIQFSVILAIEWFNYTILNISKLVRYYKKESNKVINCH
jgi:hypothetical protein